ncbi:GAF sensor signal transduction histidine kinase [Crinalium epipsammum PCC 9333]|uniref:histidine kinase n=1 Tax=Crinalium epipsammum PCC 9333 TaxID=1173022 RepID=K9W1H1_9CYAN|nr:GAF domain-containing sensor histidine kinase [Crinalium epipsammum]AFZ14041.1 GAF sensor signal transduction histidine kinase [Crinalium epipsammum PCC 9333]
MSNIAARIGAEMVMESPESRLFCRLDNFTPAVKEQQRFKILAEFGLLKTDTLPVFEEATQTACRFLETPISIVGLMTEDRQWIKSAVGLSRLGLMNELLTSRQLSRNESFCTHVVDSHQVLAISDTATDGEFSRSSLFQHYGIRAYLGAPLLTASGHCLGTLAVMDLIPRNFSSKDIEFLMLLARLVVTEIERNCLVKAKQTRVLGLHTNSDLHRYSVVPSSVLNKNESLEFACATSVNPAISINSNSHISLSQGNNQSHQSQEFTTQKLKVKLLTHISQELRTPLTSVMGMTSVLNREIYGPLSSKQKEYLNIIHHSGQSLVSLVDEIAALGLLDENNQKLQLTSVNIEMVCQQAIKSLEQVAHHRQQQLRLSVEPGNRIWLVDKDKIRQILYYLLLSLIQSAEVGCVVRIHLSHKSEKLNMALWVSHPWLGDCLPQVELYSESGIAKIANNSELLQDNATVIQDQVADAYLPLGSETLTSTPLVAALMNAEDLNIKSAVGNDSRESLGLLLSCCLAETHGGEILVQGSPEWGYRYVVSLPHIVTGDDPL